MVEVIQSDRDAGADLFLREQFTPLSAPHFRIAKDARAGKHDDWDCIQAFARHRQQAEARMTKEIGDLKQIIGMLASGEPS